MNAGFAILSLVTFLPLVGAVVLIVSCAATTRRRSATPRWIALWTTLVDLRCCRSSCWVQFDPANAGFQFVEERAWLGGAITYKMGVDGISVLFVILTDVPDAVLHPGELGVDRRRGSRNTWSPSWCSRR